MHATRSSNVGAMAKATTPWGKTEVVEELTVPQRAGVEALARRVDERGGQQGPVPGAEEGINGVLGMRHESEDVPLGADDAGDVLLGAVRVLPGHVAKCDLLLGEMGRQVVAALTV